MKFRKKPVIVEAIRWDGLSSSLYEMCHSWRTGTDAQQFIHQHEWDGSVLNIFTLEGVHRANVGDWIIRGVKGEFYPCKPDIFEATYEARPMTPALLKRRTCENYKEKAREDSVRQKQSRNGLVPSGFRTGANSDVYSGCKGSKAMTPTDKDWREANDHANANVSTGRVHKSKEWNRVRDGYLAGLLAERDRMKSRLFGWVMRPLCKVNNRTLTLYGSIDWRQVTCLRCLAKNRK